MGFFSDKPSKPAKMRTLKVALDGEAKSGSKKPGKSAKKAAQPMSFTEWVDHYAKMSKGNPV